MSERTVTPSPPSCLRSVVVLVCLAGLLGDAAGCDDGGAGRDGGAASGAGGKGDDLGDTDGEATGGDGGVVGDHQAAVLHCEAVASRLRARTHAARVDAIVALERERNDCLVTANDAAVVVVESVLAAAADPYAGTGLAAWKDHRNAALATCNAMVEGHAEAATDLRRSVAATCFADMEAQLAALLDAHVDFGAVPRAIPAARDRHGACYLAYDDALADAPGTAPLREAAAADTALAACIRERYDDAAAELAVRVVENFPGRDVAAVESELRGATGGLWLARERLCEIAAHAGPARARGGANDDFVAAAAECAVDAAILGVATFDLVAPGLVPGAPVDGDTGSGGTDDGGWDDGGTESTGDTGG